MDLLDGRARPSAEEHNERIDATDSIHQAMVPIGSGPATPSIAMMLTFYQVPYYSDAEYSGFGGIWQIIPGTPKRQRTIPGMVCGSIFDAACELRRQGRIHGRQDWGRGHFLDTTNVTAQDMFYGGAIDLPRPVSSGVAPWKSDGSGGYIADPNGATGGTPGWYLVGDATTEGHPGVNDWTTLGEIDHGPNGFFNGTPGDPSGPGWNLCPTDGEIGLYENYPIITGLNGNHAYFLNFEGNFIGAYINDDLDHYPYWYMKTSVKVDGLSLGYSQFPASITDGRTINSAKLRIKVSGLTKYTVTSNWTDFDHTDNVVTRSHSTDSVGLVMLGVYLDGDGNPRWEPVGASLGGAMVTDKWSIIDATGIVNTLLGLRDSKYYSYALLPSPIATLTGPTNGRAYLNSIMPVIEYEAYGDGYLITHQTGSYITWTGVSLDCYVIDFTLPSGENKREVVPFNLPIMADL